ncbi:MAG: hypothetical protein Q8P03_01860 [bacterium]|nr:hypothetical protein [bacterium]
MKVRTIVLVVEDDIITRRFYEELLKLIDGIEVYIKGRVQEAQELLPELLESGRRVIALIDGNINGVPGEELALQMRQMWQEGDKSRLLTIIACVGGIDLPTWGDEGCNLNKSSGQKQIVACICLQLMQTA